MWGFNIYQRMINNCYYWTRDTGRLILNIPLDKSKDGQKSVDNITGKFAI
ncbi:hypothetical protein AGMMS49573_11090 [Endomicrobiia bacterium]|nr:hypothetical protein AGMMS49573_11090 [Endomicrobiia bacterium]